MSFSMSCTVLTRDLYAADGTLIAARAMAWGQSSPMPDIRSTTRSAEDNGKPVTTW